MADPQDVKDAEPAPAPPERRPLPGAEADALATGRIRDTRVRPAPTVPSWVLKLTMAVTGVIFALFVLVHMVGNLKIFMDPEHLNTYAYWLRTAFEPLLPYEGLLWIMRIVLLVCLVAHVTAAVMISSRARASRGPRKRRGMTNLRSFAARNMLVTGTVLLAFIIFHLLDLTLGKAVAPSDYQHIENGQAYAYQNVVASFSRWPVSAFYMLALLILFVHLAHGLWTVVQDLGATGRRARAVGLFLAGAIPLAILLGNILIPIAVLTGVVK